MFGISLPIIFLFYFPSSFAHTCSAQPPNANLNPSFSGNSGNEDIAKLFLVKKCLSNLKDCAKGILLKNISQEIAPKENKICFPLGINRCFVLTNKTNWNKTREECQRLGGDLATIGLRSCPNRYLISSSFVSLSVWIGLKRGEKNLKNWQWLDGVREPSNSSIWAEGEPNNEGGENCGVLITKTARANDLACIHNRFGLCELRE